MVIKKDKSKKQKMTKNEKNIQVSQLIKEIKQNKIERKNQYKEMERTYSDFLVTINNKYSEDKKAILDTHNNSITNLKKMLSSPDADKNEIKSNIKTQRNECKKELLNLKINFKTNLLSERRELELKFKFNAKASFKIKC
jgi:hypothetical protein